ncbi:MAG: hypothetical protein Q4F05_11880 [bacterium]|nr:hypothetical protein [bacterium]
MKKNNKIITGIAVSVIAIGIVLYGLNLIWGNPYSKKLAEQAANDYIEKNYPGQQLHIENILYDVKVNSYVAEVKSETSIDNYFSVEISMTGNVKYDTYERVENGDNTYQRVYEEYRKLVEDVFDDPAFPIEDEIHLGNLVTVENTKNDHDDLEYGLEPDQLVRDKQYDVKEQGKRAGHIVCYVKEEEISFEKASELLLQIKQKMDEAEVPFFAVDLIVEKPDKTEDEESSENEEIRIYDFLYSDIYVDGLDKRVEAAHKALAEYFKAIDAVAADEKIA